MKFEKLQETGRNMSEEEIAANLRSLANEPRFAGMVAVIERHKEQFADGGSIQQLANSHGALAHNAGSIYALNCLLGRIRQVCNPAKKRAAQKPEPENED